MFDLITEASEMLRDRPRDEQDLIYAIAKLEDDLRMAICMAYRMIHGEDV